MYGYGYSSTQVAKIDAENIVEAVILIKTGDEIPEGWVYAPYPVTIGWIYNYDTEVWTEPACDFPSWTLSEPNSEKVRKWEAPTPYPDDGNFYTWDEANTSWKLS